MCPSVGLFAFILFGTLCTSWIATSIFFPANLGKIFVIIFSNRFQFLAFSLLRESLGWANSRFESQVDGSQTWHPSAGFMRGGLKRGKMASARTFFWEKAVPQLLPRCQTTQFPLVCLWCLSRFFPSSGVQKEWARVTPCSGLLRGTAWDSNRTISLSLNPHWFLESEFMGTSLPGFVILGWGGLVLDLDPCSSGGTSEAEISLPIFICHAQMWDQPVWISTAPTSLHVASSLIP